MSEEELLAATARFYEAALADYAAHCHAINPWFGQALLRRPPLTARGEELIAADAFDRTGFAADWCRRVGIWHMVGATWPVASGVMVGAGIHRPRRKGAFGDADVAVYRAATAHAAQAIRIAWRLGTAQQHVLACEAATQALGAGVILLGAEGWPVFANRLAEQVLRAGRWLTLLGGRIAARHPADRAELGAAISAAGAGAAGARPGVGGVFVLRAAPDARLTLRVAPCRAGDGGIFAPRATVLLQFDAPGPAGAPAARDPEAAHGLTPAEARLAAALAAGQRLSDHARQSGVSVNTARTLLARVFRKTGTARQADLVALLGAMRPEPRRPRRRYSHAWAFTAVEMCPQCGNMAAVSCFRVRVMMFPATRSRAEDPGRTPFAARQGGGDMRRPGSQPAIHPTGKTCNSTVRPAPGPRFVRPARRQAPTAGPKRFVTIQ